MRAPVMMGEPITGPKRSHMITSRGWGSKRHVYVYEDHVFRRKF